MNIGVKVSFAVIGIWTSTYENQNLMFLSQQAYRMMARTRLKGASSADCSRHVSSTVSVCKACCIYCEECLIMNREHIPPETVWTGEDEFRCRAPKEILLSG